MCTYPDERLIYLRQVGGRRNENTHLVITLLFLTLKLYEFEAEQPCHTVHKGYAQILFLYIPTPPDTEEPQRRYMHVHTDREAQILNFSPIEKQQLQTVRSAV